MRKISPLTILFFTVTNDLSYDQRMIRICTSLANAGYDVTLVGRKRRSSIPLKPMPFQQKRLYCFFDKGFLFYAEYNIRLFFYLLFQKMNGICAIDLDSILPCHYVSRIKKITRIYDAHELFCEMKEIVTRPRIYRVWKWIERKTVPWFRHGYTVNQPIAAEYERMYGCRYEVIRNIAVYDANQVLPEKEKFILYQGAVNEARCFETLIPAMKAVDAPLIICGDGNFMEQAKKITTDAGLNEKVLFKGMMIPAELKLQTQKAYIGITLFEPGARSNYYSLANRFFDYIHAGVPQLCVDYPVYRELNNKYEVAVLIKDTSSETIARALNDLLDDRNRWERLSKNCLEAAKTWNWQEEEKKILNFYKQVFG